MNPGNECKEDLTKKLELFNELLEKGNIEEADSILRDIVERNPGLPELVNFHGEFTFQRGKIQEAREIFLKNLNNFPEDFRSLNNLGVIEWEDKNIEKAMEYNIKAFRVNPGDRITVLNLGDMLISLKKHREAKKVYSSYLTVHPEDMEIQNLFDELNRKNEHNLKDKLLMEKKDEFRLFKRHVWQNRLVAQSYNNSIDRSSIGQGKEISIISKLAGGKILDVGSGTGKISKHLKNLGFEVIALDISVEMLKHQSSVTECLCGDCEKLPFKDGVFDTVTAIWLLLHFSNWQNIMQELLRVLKPGGILLFEVTSKEHFALASQVNPGIYEKYLTRESFEEPVSIAELESFFSNKNICLTEVIPYDYLNANEILYGLYGEQSIKDFLDKWLKYPEIISFCCWLEGTVLSSLPSGLSHKNFIIASKSEKKERVKYTCTKTLNIDQHLLGDILENKNEQFYLEFIEFLYNRNVREFFREFFRKIFSKLNLDINKFFELINLNILPHSIQSGLNVLIQEEYLYWIEEFTTGWYQNISGTEELSICNVPIGPVAEYYLTENIVKFIREREKNEL